jgi:GAF domain-containing protein
LADLRSGLSSLSNLATGQLSLEEMLTHVATFAVRAIPGADGAGLTLLEDGRADTIVATDPFVTEVDAIQYGLGEGPCISAAAERRTMRSGSLGSEQRWPTFGPHVDRLGVHSVLSLPLLTPDGVFGAMNVYAHARDVFDEHAAELGEIFAVPAAIAVQNAHVLDRARRLAANLQEALSIREVVDQALGVLRSSNGWTAAEAFEHLRSISRAQRAEIADVAQVLIDEAVRAARQRRADN